jgi:hypothetical protein
MMSKWILKACEPGQSNLHTLLRFRLRGYQPYSQGRWLPSLEFFTRERHQCKRGSTPWNRVTSAWKSMRKALSFVRLQSHEELLNESFWWSNFFLQLDRLFLKPGRCPCTRRVYATSKMSGTMGLFFLHEKFVACSASVIRNSNHGIRLSKQ